MKSEKGLLSYVSGEAVKRLDGEVDGVYAKPKTVTDTNECYFYHTIDLPGYGTIKGNWDLRGGLKEYLGRTDFRDKRVLDVGTANGMLSFQMEKQGAQVVAYDLSKDFDWDMVPFAQYDYLTISDERKRIIDRLNNAFWFCHRLLNSNVKVVYGNAYKIPDEIGLVDISVYGAILLHLRDPFLALQSGLRLARHKVIIVEQVRGQPIQHVRPYMEFLPDPLAVHPKDVWWGLRPEVIIRMIGVLGFEEVSITHHTQIYDGKETMMYTVVGERTKDWPPSRQS